MSPVYNNSIPLGVIVVYGFFPTLLCCQCPLFIAGQSYKRKAFNPNAPGLKGLEWDGAELFMVCSVSTSIGCVWWVVFPTALSLRDYELWRCLYAGDGFFVSAWQVQLRCRHCACPDHTSLTGICTCAVTDGHCWPHGICCSVACQQRSRCKMLIWWPVLCRI